MLALGKNTDSSERSFGMRKGGDVAETQAQPVHLALNQGPVISPYRD
jgi:hypothetical protein